LTFYLNFFVHDVLGKEEDDEEGAAGESQG
jgi:hypothetical protein